MREAGCGSAAVRKCSCPHCPLFPVLGAKQAPMNKAGRTRRINRLGRAGKAETAAAEIYPPITTSHDFLASLPCIGLQQEVVWFSLYSPHIYAFGTRTFLRQQ